MTSPDLRLPPADTIETQDRRACDRVDAVIRCKAHCLRLGRYIAGVTTNVSEAGLLLRIERAPAIAPGDELRIGVAQSGSDALLDSASLRPARVVRVTPIDHHHQAIAVAYTDAALTGDRLDAAMRRLSLAA